MGTIWGSKFKNRWIFQIMMLLDTTIEWMFVISLTNLDTGNDS